MTVVLSVVKAFFDMAQFAGRTYYDLVKEGNDKPRTDMLQDAMKLLNSKGGKLVNVDASFLEFNEFLRDDIAVRIAFHEKAASGLYQEQQSFFEIDPSSWATLHDGLNGLSYKFADAIQRTYTDNEVPHPHWKKDYAEFMAKVEKQRLVENKL